MKQSSKCLEVSLFLDPNGYEGHHLLYGLYHNNPWYLGGSQRKAKTLLKQLETIDPAYTAIIRAGDLDFHNGKDRLVS